MSKFQMIMVARDIIHLVLKFTGNRLIQCSLDPSTGCSALEQQPKSWSHIPCEKDDPLCILFDAIILKALFFVYSKFRLSWYPGMVWVVVVLGWSDPPTRGHQSQKCPNSTCRGFEQFSCLSTLTQVAEIISTSTLYQWLKYAVRYNSII